MGTYLKVSAYLIFMVFPLFTKHLLLDFSYLDGVRLQMPFTSQKRHDLYSVEDKNSCT